jgi:hypothetical protein
MEYQTGEVKLDIRIKDHYTDDELTLLVNIGHSLETGSSLFEPNHSLALGVYGLAAKSGDAIAMNNYGWMTLNGLGTSKDIGKAISAFEDAASRGYTVAMVNLGNIYANLEDYVEAEFGDLKIVGDAIFLTQRVSIENEYVDYNKAAKWYRRAMEYGNAKGAFNYANVLFAGRGVQKNRKKAFNIFSNLFEIGHPGSAFYLGLYHQQGFIGKRNYDLARRFYIIGATSGDVNCYNQLGVMYAKGLGVKRDFSFALEYYSIAAEGGDSLSMANIGWLYLNGDGVSQDYKEAFMWFNRAFEKGFKLETESAGPLNTLGWLYQNGWGTERNHEKAVELYKKAADLGNSDAQANLGAMLENGWGIKKDLSMAIFWYRKSAKQGDTDALKALARLEEI